MSITDWIIGPQLTGIILVLISALMLRFPPRQINGYYGYRMPSSMKSQAAWDEANRYSSAYMLKAGLIVIIVGIIIAVVLATTTMPGNIRVAMSIGSMLAPAIVPAVLVIVATEKHLTRKFGDK